MQTGTMTNIATRPIVRSRPLVMTVWILAFAIATALSANVRIPLPFTPVPVTLQTFFVLMAGLVLGPGPAAVSMALYLVAGAVGLPVWAGAAGASGEARNGSSGVHVPIWSTQTHEGRHHVDTGGVFDGTGHRLALTGRSDQAQQLAGCTSQKDFE